MTRDDFGYWEVRLQPVYGIQIAEGKHPDTLEPILALYLRPGGPEAEQIGFALRLEQATALAEDLVQWVQRAREKDFRQD